MKQNYPLIKKIARSVHYSTILLLLLAISILPDFPAASQGNGNGPTLDIQAITQAKIGQPIEIKLTVRNASDLAGYETALLFDTTAAEYGGLQQRKNDLKKMGRDVSPLTVVDLPNGAAFGFFTCPFTDCVSRQGAKKDKGANGTVRLAMVTLFAKQPGSLEIKFDATKFVDSTGQPIQVDMPNTKIVVQVENASPYHAASGSMWSLSGQTSGSAGPFDMTGDGLVTHEDAMEVSLDWETTHMNAAPCSQLPDPTRDVNHDGCIDVADLQMLASHLDAGTNKQSSAANNSDQQAGSQGTNTQAATTASSTSLTFTVNSVADDGDKNIGNGICATSLNQCTLRAAIQEAQAHAGPDTIAFNIPGAGLHTIQLTKQLPTLNGTGGATTIDGYTQPGSSSNTDAHISNAVITVEVVGGGENNYDGFVVITPGNVFRGLSLYKFKRAFHIYGSGASGNYVTGCFIGTNPSGTYGASVTYADSHGFHIEQGAASNYIGGPSAAERNVISGNARHGVGLWHEATDSNTVENNILGLSPDGTRVVPNLKHGLDINYGSSSNVYQNNVSSGNADTGIEISHTTGTRDNLIKNNYIGTNVTGTGGPASFGNGFVGMTIEDGASFNTVVDNVVGNNAKGGIQINYGAYSTDNHLYNNRVGISLNGTPIPNGDYGFLINGVHNLIGPDNIVAYNAHAGIRIIEDDKDNNTFTQNSIFQNGDLGIDLFPARVTLNDPGDLDSGPNQNLNFPVLTSASPTQVSGTACGGCTVEIFIADSSNGAYGEGKTFIGSTTTNSDGTFTVTVSGTQSGNYVTSTATDSTGNTSEFSLNLLVSGGTNTGSMYASDTFTRNVSDAWGSADTGGSYTLYGSSARFDVNGSAGTITTSSAGIAGAAVLDGVSAQDVDSLFQVQTNKVASGNSEYAYSLGRRISTNTEYRGQVRLTPNGTIGLRALAVNNGTVTALGTETIVSGLTYSANSVIWIRVQYVGTNPTTIRMRAWADGQAEPTSWQYTTNDSTASLQTAGSVGLMANLPASSTNAPVIFTIDNYSVIQATP